MVGKREAKREALKLRLMEAATGRIITGGLGGLRARDIAMDAGCALGGLYNVYESLDDLILHINSATLGRLNGVLEQAATMVDTPRDKLVALAREYLAFAIDNRNLWQALFDHKMPEGVSVPDWHLAEHGILFGHVAAPIAVLKPDLDTAELHVMARTLFAAVHGIVSISLREGFIAIPREALDVQLTEFVQMLVKGMEHSSTN